jgi:starch phosphorylase
MNEGHSALLTLALLREHAASSGSVTADDIESVARLCVFTTHTPVPAGHDQFALGLVREVIGDDDTNLMLELGCCLGDVLNMTNLALFFSRYINGVSMRHEEISRNEFPHHPINSITNGVHAATWTSPPIQRLFDSHIPEWRRDNLYLRYAIGIPLREIEAAHAEAKGRLLTEVERRSGSRLEQSKFTIGFARRATAYKRIDLLFTDLERLRGLAKSGGLQVVCGGKAHPQDESGKAMIRRVFQAAGALGESVPVIYLEGYDTILAQYLCAGVDVWLNTPQRPMEASGTSGMKAALNGVPSLSILDGWWIEGAIEGVTGWSIADDDEVGSDSVNEVASLYEKLEEVALPMFYERPADYAKVMRSAIAVNGAFYNAQRMVSRDQVHAYQERS